MIILAYLGPFSLIPFLAEKDDPDIQWHAKHGLVLFGVDVIIGFLLGVASASCIGCFIVPFVFLIIMAVHIICMVKGVNGERFLIPGLSEFADKF